MHFLQNSQTRSSLEYMTGSSLCNGRYVGLVFTPCPNKIASREKNIWRTWEDEKTNKQNTALQLTTKWQTLLSFWTTISCSHLWTLPKSNLKKGRKKGTGKKKQHTRTIHDAVSFFRSKRSTCYFPLANALREAKEWGAKQNRRERERELRAAAVCTLGFPGLRVPTEGDDRSSSHVQYVDEARRSM
jgi:hypothetical protein